MKNLHFFFKKKIKTLIKFDSVALKRIRESSDPATTADAAAIVMDEGIASLCLLKPNMTITVAKIEVSIPRKRRGSTDQHDTSWLVSTLVHYFRCS